MFKGMAADLSGTADVCKCIPRQSIAQESVMAYLLPGEKPYILLKSKKEEHLFTNLGYICFSGNNATTTRRTIVRYDFFQYAISGVYFETAGMGVTDRDVELKFNIGSQHVSIDIWKDEINTALVYYKALLTLAHHQHKNAVQLEYAKIAVS